MVDFLLAKPTLLPNFIDVSVGEAHVVRKNLLDTFDISTFELPKDEKIFEYHEPQGYKPLIQLLEDKFQAPVVVCNGAKNALGAVFFALKQIGKNIVSLSNPYWALLPPIIEMHGLQWKSTYDGCDSHLLVLPNNPDNWVGDSQFIAKLEQDSKEKNIPLIHDAVYYNHIYLPDSYSLNKIGDVQIYSASKSYGLSGIRVGWVVCHNKEFYKLVRYYMETMTVGVSVISQIFLHHLLNMMHERPHLTKIFENLSSIALTKSKKIIKQVDPEILEVPSNMENTPGMFGFFKYSNSDLFTKAKINPAWGEYFGAPGFVRINLAFPEDQMKEIVRRLNAVKEK